MIAISEAAKNDIKTIQNIVYKTWPITYGEILSEEQLQYMLDLFYSEEALTAQFDKKEQLFYLITEEKSTLGFIGIEHNYQDENITKIHKIYILPETQGKGIGKFAIEAIEKFALENSSASVILNVNRFNKALNFYEKIGFKIIDEVNIEIGKGYLMEDYVMIKKL
ncbi:ribosomal protein S18 acetylase RimI-like enzyme [Flavobacterium sp. 1]|uniref:GNAT family N-acetyltransferase n=1 Tax=Flavobacterium sp. 1 TaxID=2035200 RepID=UPI000C2451AF|nr:GNAT family N-acetyltransferase [Flavobacterium sp. 1]PJJ07491.1 ribosomal protein S18 acetylase RimI-like enzyme [Flavobacterium sp. 1]